MINECNKQMEAGLPHSEYCYAKMKTQPLMSSIPCSLKRVVTYKLTTTLLSPR